MIRFRTETEALIRFVTRLLVAAYLIEAGFLLVVAPWTRVLWEHNAVFALVPGLGAATQSLFVRGAVSGVGILALFGGLRDLLSLFFARRSDVTSDQQVS